MTKRDEILCVEGIKIRSAWEPQKVMSGTEPNHRDREYFLWVL
jgi:hypothetical protein